MNVGLLIPARPSLKSLFHPVTPAAVSGSELEHAAWTDLDLSAYIPPGVRGVILEVYNASAGVVNYGIRENGSTDARYDRLSGSAKCYAIVGVDSSRVIEFQNSFTSNAGARLVVIGYVQNDSRVVINTNAPTDILSGMALGAWTDVDLSVSAPGAIGVILDVFDNSGNADAFGFRQNGSSDNRIATTIGHNCFTVVVGCDGAQVIEAYHAVANVRAYLRGYITADFTFNTNATDRSIAAGAYTDISAPVGAGMVIMEVVSNGSYDFDLKGKGRVNGQVADAQLHCWAFAPPNDAFLLQGYVENAGVDFFEIGYAALLR